MKNINIYNLIIKLSFKQLKMVRLTFKLFNFFSGLRPVIHASCPPPLCALMENAWNADPNKRPTAVEVNKNFVCFVFQKLFAGFKRIGIRSTNV